MNELLNWLEFRIAIRAGEMQMYIKDQGKLWSNKELDLEKEKAFLDDQGIIHSIRNTSNLDEAAGAYKDINIVMNNQKDLVDIVVELTPLAVIKG